MTAPVILWLRRDLRLADQPALVAAAHQGPVIPVYVLDDDAPRHHAMGGASRWWLHHSLTSLDADLRDKGSRLVLRRGKAADVIAAIAAEKNAGAVHAIAHYEPWWRNAERHLAKALGGVPLCLHDGNYLLPAGSLTTGSGRPYQIFTPFWKALRERMPPRNPLRRPARIDAPTSWPASDTLSDWNLLPTLPNWAQGFTQEWTPGEAGAKRRLDAFVDAVDGYDRGRNMPSEEGSSRLSPHLHFGEISPARIWHRLAGQDRLGGSRETFLKELAWRDYAQNVIVQYPHYATASHRDAFGRLEWRDRRGADFDRWCKGQTGYPIVDAGMRQLWATGWMHNRVRMIAASFLIKHLLIDWRHGEQWFWDTLVDADYGSNAVNWQWVAGSGVDSNMFVRIMAPLVQSEKFDAADYIREWVPELAGLPDSAIHDPETADCRPDSYPAKIIGHKQARERALAAWRHAAR